MLLFEVLKFITSPPHPDKMPSTFPSHILPIPSKRIPPLLQKYSLSVPIRHAILMLKDDPENEDLSNEFEKMRVMQFSQYRSEKSLHECILVEYAYQPITALQPLAVDSRVARLEHYKRDNIGLYRLDSTSPYLMTNIIETSRIDKFDHISISDKVPFSGTQDFSGLLLPHYKLVRSFRPPPGTLSFIEAISIADAVATAVREYSSLHYISFWFANMMYLATKSYINFDGVENKSTSGLAAAGKFKGFKLVDPDTGAINLEHWSKNERGLEDLYQRFYTPGFSTRPPEDLDALLRLVSKDKELLGREGASELLGVPSIVAAAQVNQNELSEFFLNKYQAARDRRER